MIDLDALRALCKSDVRTQRAILANRKEREDLDRELFDLRCKPVLRGSPMEQEMEARREALHARFEELLRQKMTMTWTRNRRTLTLRQNMNG